MQYLTPFGVVTPFGAFCAVFRGDGVEVVASPEQPINAGNNQHECAEAVVIGGAMPYAEALPRAGRVYLTEVDAAPDGDTIFPVLDKNQWREIARERREVDEKNIHAMEFVVQERITV